MTTSSFSHIVNEAVPSVPILLGPSAEEFLEALILPQGGVVDQWRVTQIRYTPGRSLVVRYQAQVRWRDGNSTRETLVATAGLNVPEDVPVLSADGVEIAVWTFPNDPFLPGLATAAGPDRVIQLLGQVGIEAGAVKLRLRAYRPGRRAVIEARTPGARLFIKVVRPDEAPGLQHKHAELAKTVPVPHSHGWNEELGLVALQAMPGKPLSKALSSGKRRLPAAEQFVALLGSLPAPSSPSTPVPGPHERVAFHTALLKAVTPEIAGRIDEAAARTSVESTENAVPVHGDFHSSQILVRGADVAGLIDVDTAGAGSRSNDLAVLLAHMSVVGLTTGARRHIDHYGAGLIDHFDALVDPGDLRRKVAKAVLAFATGPFRVNLPRWRAQTERRLALAERWIRSADVV